MYHIIKRFSILNFRAPLCAAIISVISLSIYFVCALFHQLALRQKTLKLNLTHI